MGRERLSAHPYVPNGASVTRASMLAEIGVPTIESLYAAIPADLRVQRPLELPDPVVAEADLARHMEGLLAKNVSTREVISFLGSGCYMHHVPEVCSEINGRGEFLTAYAGEPYEDHGKWQALFEYVSLMADLLEMDVVNVPTYDGYQAAATSLRMAGRVTRRRRVVIVGGIDPAKLAKIVAYLDGWLQVEVLPLDPTSGAVNLDALAGLLDADVAAVHIETPGVTGIVHHNLARIAELAHDAGAVVVCATDPLSLGFQAPPATWGADIVCGDIQSLGLGLHFGGANGGFIAIHDDERFVFELPSRLFGLSPTVQAGELGFTDVAYERTSLAMREEGVEWVGTAAALWGITAAVYLSLMGPQGLAELGSTIADRTRYAIEKLRSVPGLVVEHADQPHWREFAVRYERHTVASVNSALHDRGFFGGAGFEPGELGPDPVSVFCVTELHSRDDIDQLAVALREILS
jgi:glycine dehydrogenase subunit 1